MRKCLTDIVYGKEERKVLLHVLKVSDVIGWLMLPALCVGIYFACRRTNKKKAPPAEQPGKKANVTPASPVSQPVSERKALTDEYCRVCKALDAYRDRDVYRDQFSKIGVFIQLLLGSRRRWLEEGNSEELLQALNTMVNNLRLRETLTAEGLQIKTVPSMYDEAALRRLCEKAEISAIRTELEKQKRWLLQYRAFLDCKGILNDSASLMYQIVQDVQAQDAEGCFAKVQELERFLEKRGCYAIYWTDSRVAASESIRVDFREDNPWTTELPGLYTKKADGTYHRIGVLGGTMRRV